MKKISLLFILSFIASSAFGDELASMWTRLYNRLDTLEYKLEIMQNITEQESRELVPVITEALSETNSRRSGINDHNEKRLYNQLQRITIRKLGEFKAIEAEEQIFESYRSTDDLLVKTEAITALGRMGSTRYTEEFSQLLGKINMRLSGNANMRENEAIAYSLIAAFENMRRIETYEPVFYASFGWYSPRSGIRDRAKKALKIISDDPSEVLLQILKKESDLRNKYLALEALSDSSSPDSKKTALAVQGLHEGITNKAGNITEKTLRQWKRLP